MISRHHLKMVLLDLVTLRTTTDFVIVLGITTLFVACILIPVIDAVMN